MAKHYNVYLGLDIGDSKICASVCELDENQQVHVRGVGSSISSGIGRTMIIEDPEELGHAIDRAIKRAYRDSGFTPNRVITNIPVHQMQFVRNVGVVLSKETSGLISESDRVECIRRTQNVTRSLDQKAVHVIPVHYRVDGQEVMDPVGVKGRHLEVETLVVLAHGPTIVALTDVLKKLNLHISGLMYDGIATSHILLTREERLKGAVLWDIGGRVTKISVFKDNMLQAACVIPIGGETLSRDVSACLKITLPEAERLKILHGDIVLNRVNPQDGVEIMSQDTGRRVIKKLLLSQILEARIAELARMSKKNLPLLFEHKTPIVLTGGGSLLSGVSEYFESRFSMPVREGLPDDMYGSLDDQHFSTSIGLVLYAVRIKAITHVASPRLAFIKQVWAMLKALFS